MTTNWYAGTQIEPAQLPTEISTYLVAHQARDLDTAMSSYTTDASVTDEGRTFVGREAIRAWLAQSASEFTYTMQLTAARKVNADHYLAVHHLVGNFPGGVADLQFEFTMRGGLIERLVIEP
jgi:ketosteroid isomerase-like protein